MQFINLSLKSRFAKNYLAEVEFILLNRIVTDTLFISSKNRSAQQRHHLSSKRQAEAVRYFYSPVQADSETRKALILQGFSDYIG